MRWLVASIGVAAVAAGAWALLAGPGASDAGRIDPASRAALERALEDGR